MNQPRVERRRARGPGPRLLSATALAGVRVSGSQGEPLGTLQEIVLDVAHGRIAYAVLGCGGFMGVGERLFVVPWKALQFDTAHGAFVLDADERALDEALPFDKERFPSEPDARWHQQVHRHWRSAPYWD